MPKRRLRRSTVSTCCTTRFIAKMCWPGPTSAVGRTAAWPGSMTSVAAGVSDGHVLQLLKMWLEAPVEETDQRGRKQRTYSNRNTGRGTPQGAPLSPLLANLYMRRFVLGWKVLGHGQRLAAR